LAPVNSERPRDHRLLAATASEPRPTLLGGVSTIKFRDDIT